MKDQKCVTPKKNNWDLEGELHFMLGECSILWSKYKNFGVVNFCAKLKASILVERFLLLDRCCNPHKRTLNPKQKYKTYHLVISLHFPLDWHRVCSPICLSRLSFSHELLRHLVAAHETKRIKNFSSRANKKKQQTHKPAVGNVMMWQKFDTLPVSQCRMSCRNKRQMKDMRQRNKQWMLRHLVRNEVRLSRSGRYGTWNLTRGTSW